MPPQVSEPVANGPDQPLSRIGHAFSKTQLLKILSMQAEPFDFERPSGATSFTAREPAQEFRDPGVEHGHQRDFLPLCSKPLRDFISQQRFPGTIPSGNTGPAAEPAGWFQDEWRQYLPRDTGASTYCLRAG